MTKAAKMPRHMLHVILSLEMVAEALAKSLTAFEPSPAVHDRRYFRRLRGQLFVRTGSLD